MYKTHGIKDTNIALRRMGTEVWLRICASNCLSAYETWNITQTKTVLQPQWISLHIHVLPAEAEVRHTRISYFGLAVKGHIFLRWACTFLLQVVLLLVWIRMINCCSLWISSCMSQRWISSSPYFTVNPSILSFSPSQVATFFWSSHYEFTFIHLIQLLSTWRVMAKYRVHRAFDNG